MRAPPPEMAALDARPCAVQSVCMPPDKGWRYDTTERGNGNGGHEYGTRSRPRTSVRSIEYLKTL